MIALLAWRSLLYRPRRSLLLFAGFGVGVGVMVVLLAIGEAMLAQARDEKLVGGGDLSVLPEGMDLEVMKTGGVGGLYLSIPNARFVNLQLLSSERLSSVIETVSPQIDGKLLYLRARGRGGAWQEWPVRGTGEIPSATRRLGALPPVVTGTWQDDEGDRRWMHPDDATLRHAIDHFHLPPPASAGTDRESWAEWHYFNLLLDGGRRWAFVTLMVAGDVPRGRWGGRVLVTLQGIGEPARRFAADVPAGRVRISETSADVTSGDAFVRVLPDGRYEVSARAPSTEGDDTVSVTFELAPAPGAYFPGTMLADDAVTSGYAVAALRGTATGRLCEGRRCRDMNGVPAYHDHNWGYWRNVDWEWGAATAGSWGLLYGRIQQVDSTASETPLFLYLTDSLGFRALFRPREVRHVDGRSLEVGGRTLRVPSRAELSDVRGADTVRVQIFVEEATATDTRLGTSARGRPVRRPWFIQMKGRVRITGVIGGQRLTTSGQGFFETYR